MSVNKDGIEAGRILTPRELVAAKAEIRKKEELKTARKPKENKAPE